MKARQND